MCVWARESSEWNTMVHISRYFQHLLYQSGPSGSFCYKLWYKRTAVKYDTASVKPQDNVHQMWSRAYSRRAVEWLLAKQSLLSVCLLSVYILTVLSSTCLNLSLRWCINLLWNNHFLTSRSLSVSRPFTHLSHDQADLWLPHWFPRYTRQKMEEGIFPGTKQCS